MGGCTYNRTGMIWAVFRTFRTALGEAFDAVFYRVFLRFEVG